MCVSVKQYISSLSCLDMAYTRLKFLPEFKGLISQIVYCKPLDPQRHIFTLPKCQASRRGYCYKVHLYLC